MPNASTPVEQTLPSRATRKRSLPRGRSGRAFDLCVPKPLSLTAAGPTYVASVTRRPPLEKQASYDVSTTPPRSPAPAASEGLPDESRSTSGRPSRRSCPRLSPSRSTVLPDSRHQPADVAGEAGLGKARQGWAGHGGAWQARRGRAWQVAAGHGMAGEARHGRAWRGWARPGVAWQAWHGEAGARLGARALGRGVAGHGVAGVAGLGKDGVEGVGEARCGKAGAAWQGPAGQGPAWLGPAGRGRHRGRLAGIRGSSPRRPLDHPERWSTSPGNKPWGR